MRATAALQNGEVDWWEIPPPDLVPLLRKNRNVLVDIADPLGNIGTLFFNHLYPPFNDVRARRAILMALSQEDYMRAYVGDDDKMWKLLPGYFTPGSPLFNEEGDSGLAEARLAAGVMAPIGNHSFRVTGITAYLANGGALEQTQAMAAHENLPLGTTSRPASSSLARA
jgi:peptide/nickel transport system substrate-binding protein